VPIASGLSKAANTASDIASFQRGVRGALEADDELFTLGEQPRFRVRETPDWKQHAADLEAEMIGRGMIFDLIDWDR
jgi:hypothetical protein